MPCCTKGITEKYVYYHRTGRNTHTHTHLPLVVFFLLLFVLPPERIGVF